MLGSKLDLILLATSCALLLHTYLFYRLCSRVTDLEYSTRQGWMLVQRRLDEMGAANKMQFDGMQESIHRAIFEFKSSASLLHSVQDRREDPPKQDSDDRAFNDSID